MMAIHNRYEELFHKLLKALCPPKADLIDFIEYSLTITGKDCKYPIHDDVPNKLLSTVVYLKPEENKGTILHPCPKYITFNGEKALPNEGCIIDWKPNRALIFSRIHQKTWHSYQGDGKNNRLTFVINLGTDKLNEVMKIENSKEFKNSITWSN